jgi:GNAT superfamily N-acetyltransferase
MKIRGMRDSDIEFAFECTNSEGWLSETRETFRAFLEYDPEGCFIAERKGRNIGICIATKYESNGFLGELIVIKEERGKGFGRRLLEHSVQYLKAHPIHNVFLDGDLGAVGMYEKLGFRRVCKSFRFIGRLEGEGGRSIQPVKSEDIETICQIDKELFGDDRSFFLRRRIALFPNLFKVLKIDDEICGYISGQPGNGLTSVGPWALTRNVTSPLELLASLSNEIGDGLMRIGILERNSEAAGLMRSIPTFEEREYCWRMVMGSSAELGMNDSLLAVGSAAKG